MVIIVRLDLDRYELNKLTDLIRDGVVQIHEACESKSFKALDDLRQLMQVRAWKQVTSVKKAS